MDQPPSMIAVRARKVVKTFGATAALRGVDAELRAGVLTLIEGANGSGKTTLLKVLGSILTPTAGKVDYEPASDDLMRIRSRIGWLSHEPLAYGDLSGRDNVVLAARLHGLDPRQAWEQVAERFGLGRFAERPLRTNSRGQRQRVALARALVHRPSLVLLDEPAAGLDRQGMHQLLSLVDEELARDTALAVVSHEQGLFDERAGARIVLERGKVVDAG